MRTISVVTPCYNEEGSVVELYNRIKKAFEALPHIGYQHLFIDNASQDGTVLKLRELAARDPRVKVILNARNFGQIRSPMYGFLVARGDAVIVMASDLQDPPELIPELVCHWEGGARMVLGVKTSSDENKVIYWLRSRYYRLVRQLAGMETFEHVTGFGLYDRSVVEIIRKFDDPYPYFRGMLAEIGLPHVKVPYHQPQRSAGRTKNNIYTLYDLAILGITSFSKAPLRLFTLFGFACSVVSVFLSLGYLAYKLIFWNRFSVGVAPIAIGLFFFASIQLIFIGILGEYVGVIHTHVLRRPLVIEAERINFDDDDALTTTHHELSQ